MDSTLLPEWFRKHFLVGVLPCRGRERAARRRAEREAGARWREANRRSLPFRMARARALDDARRVKLGGPGGQAGAR